MRTSEMAVYKEENGVLWIPSFSIDWWRRQIKVLQNKKKTCTSYWSQSATAQIWELFRFERMLMNFEIFNPRGNGDTPENLHN